MDKPVIRIAVGKSISSWDDRFLSALAVRKATGYPLEYSLISVERHDWVELLEPYDVIIWKPDYMGPNAVAQFQAKVYLLETYYTKLVVPNFSTIWHFENKIAQSYIFNLMAVPTPFTTTSFDYHDAMARLKGEPFPLVFKKPFGAGGQNVTLVESLQIAKRKLVNVFSHQLWQESERRSGARSKGIVRSLLKWWFWAKLWKTMLHDECYKSVYWQHFVPFNKSDLRITVIGDRYAFGFWRKNRPNDFRASGSGILDYNGEIPLDVLTYCVGLNRKMHFDSMAYDILFEKKNFLITEMSYAYLDTAIYNAPGYWEVQEGKYNFIGGHYWPQELWINWALQRAEKELKLTPKT